MVVDDKPAAAGAISPRMTSRQVGIVAAVIAACAIAFGLLIDNTFVVTLTAYACAFSLFALSINIMLGWLGEVALGQSIFFGIGAYGVGVGMLKLGMSYEMSVVLGLAVSVALAACIGALTLKLTGAYFSIVSWGLSGVAVVAAINLEAITGGPLGMYGFQGLTIGPFDLTNARTYFFVTATILFVVVLLLREVRDSRFGASLESIRQNRHLAQSVGIDIFRERLKALMLSAPLAALGGALCLPYTQIVTPEVFSVINTVDALLMVLLGGSGLIVGPIIGAAIFSIIPYFLELDANVRILVFSVAIILIMIFVPGGLHQLGRRLLAGWRQ